MASRIDPLAAHAAADHLASRSRPVRLAWVARNRVPPCRRSAWGAGCKPAISHAEVSDGRMPNDLDPERFTLRQAAQARDDFAQIMDELDLDEAVRAAPQREPPPV